jgi:D-beta-D-heptose 7-phosphate kinase / D-beta-D-heptose 1-phosphate adenosyltransferase
MALVAASQVAGLDLEVGLRLANLGAGIVISRLGTSVVSRRELCDAVQRDLDAGSASKLHTWASIVELTQHWRSAGQKVVFTNGCFDLLHVGHVTYLENAKRLGDRLVVGVNTDRSVRALKGPDRPIVTERDRAAVLASLESIDAVVLFDEDTPLSLINTVKPEVLAKGADYSEDQVVGAREVRSWGGQVSLLPLVAGQSTTRLLAKATEPQESAGGDFSSSGSE